MTESPSKTSNHQRLDEMMLHLTPVGAVIPYSICYDSNGSLWVASKGGLFKFDGPQPSIEKVNPFPKKMAPYCQVHAYKDKIVHVQAEDKEALTEFRIYTLDGEMVHEQFIDGKINSLAIAANSGDIFLTKQLVAGEDESIIYKSNMSAPLGFDELSSAFDYCFQSLCTVGGTLFVAVSSMPINMYSKQSIKIVDQETGKIRATISQAGKEDGQIFFPRSIQCHKDHVLILDKTGRIQRFNRDGAFVDVAATIDAYLGNGFTIRDEKAIIACSGIVLDREGLTICDDWVESITLDGAKWTS